ncbi:Malate dehydrogenase, cytoplasmic [Clarias magur]|uniref:Malate dehydrogenase, cytoplasmic n=1 Tax=Clarias magur TaxID=1594786 RepID=A0A8J4USM1_CLAMG|nr:Malate dehydrogenase, cytoplasmic [Clarias magur]
MNEVRDKLSLQLLLPTAAEAVSDVAILTLACVRTPCMAAAEVATCYTLIFICEGHVIERMQQQDRTLPKLQNPGLQLCVASSASALSVFS